MKGEGGREIRAQVRRREGNALAQSLSPDSRFEISIKVEEVGAHQVG